MTTMMILSMGRVYGSELRRSPVLLLISQVIYLNDVDRGKQLIRLPEPSGSPTSRVSSRQEERAKEMRIWLFEVLFFILERDFLHAVKSYDVVSGFTPAPTPQPKEGVLRIFIALKHHCLCRV
jgi:hypothetical protein